MKRTTVVGALTLLVLAAGGCAILNPAQVPEPPPSAAAATSPGTPPASPSPTKAAPSLTASQRNGVKPPKGYTTAPNAKVFDFAELPKGFYHCDTCTIKAVVKKFGSPTTMFAELGEAANEWVELDYPAMTLRLAPHTHLWDKPNDVVGGKKFSVSSQDKTLPMSTTFVQLSDPGSVLPRGLAIGRSSRTEVEAAYPQDSATIRTATQLTYPYVWFKNKKQAFANRGAGIGTLSYEFDASGMLSAVAATWAVA